MTSLFVIPETTVTQQGSGPAIEWSQPSSLVTLGILSVEEQQSLHVSLWHSVDGSEWGTKPVLQFAQKFYPGTHRMVLASAAKFIQARWHVNRWGRGDMQPRFTFYVFIERLEEEESSMS